MLRAQSLPVFGLHHQMRWIGRPRARDIGINVGILDPGPLNAITDVHGVLVGHAAP